MLNDSGLLELNSSKSRLLEFERMRKLELKQKSRIKWEVEGDDNSSFFHGYIRNKNRKNRITRLSINGSWVSDPSLIKEKPFRFFANKFKESCQFRPLLINESFSTLLTPERDNFEAPFSVE